MAQAFFEKNESNVRTYCRAFPAIFKHAKGCPTSMMNKVISTLTFYPGRVRLIMGTTTPQCKKS